MKNAVTAAGPILLLTVLSIAFTWPLADLRDPQLPQHNDALFSVWRLAWVAHQIRANPAALFDANIFWPEPNTLAMSDAMLLLGLVSAPLVWLGVHPVVVHNLLLIASFVAAGYGMMRLLRFLGAGSGGQVIGAVIFGFAPYRVAHIGHLELLWTALLPVALLCLYRVLEKPTAWRGVLLGVTIGLQALSSIYYVVFLCILLVPATLLAPRHLTVPWSLRHARVFLLAIVTAGVIVAPYAVVYNRARESVPPRTEAEVQRYSATPRDYFNVPAANRLYPSAPPPELADERTLFVGVVAMLLAMVAVARRRSRAVVPFALLGAIAVDLSFGTNGVLYDVLGVLVPALDGFRAPARFAVFVVLSVAVLAGLAMASFAGRTRRLMTALVVATIMIEYWSAPVHTMKMPTEAPDVYRWLAQRPRTVTLEWPAPVPEALWKDETVYQYFSIYHWQPLVNGYSGYVPPEYARMLERVRHFPAEPALQALVRNRVDVVLLHERLLPPGEFDALLLACGDTRYFSEVRVFDDSVLKRSAACILRAEPSA